MSLQKHLVIICTTIAVFVATHVSTQILDNGVAVFEALCGTTMRSLDSPDFLDGVRKGNDSGREARMRWLIYFFLAARIC